MATTFIVRTDKTKGLVPLHVRVQYSTPKLNLRLKTPLNVPIEKWTLSRSGAAWANYAQSESGSFVVSSKEKAPSRRARRAAAPGRGPPPG